MRFQSLFFWNSRPDDLPRLHHRTLSWVSILVFLELAPGRSGEPSGGISTSSFNPCFSGTRARTAFAGLAASINPGFNPCFSGTRARTVLHVVGIHGRFGFQSLFFWNSRPDGIGAV